MKVTLPNGLIDGLDYFNVVEVDELRGKQQNYLSNRELVVGNIGHVPKILEDCIKSLETESGMPWQGDKKELIYRLPSGDLETILIKIREATFGERFYYEADCTHCGHKNKDLRISLNELSIEKMSKEDMLDSSKRTITLPKSGKKVEFKPLYLKDMFEIVKIANGSNEDLITATVSLSIKTIDGVPCKKEHLDDLSAADIAYINEQAADMKLEGSIDTMVITECANSKCKKEFESKLNPYDPSFFGPTKGYKTISI